MSSLKEIKTRIGSVKNTLKITSAMKMVASAKLHKAQTAIGNKLPYEQKLHHILSGLLQDDDLYKALHSKLGFGNPDGHPAVVLQDIGLDQVPTKDVYPRIAIVAFSSNSSLCGAFNANVIKKYQETISLLEGQGYGTDDIDVYAVGRKISDAASKSGYRVVGDYPEMADKPSYEQASALAHTLVDSFISGEVAQVVLVYSHFASPASQPVVRENYLPLPLHDYDEGAAEPVDYILEPDPISLARNLLPLVLLLKIYTVLLDANASEHAARTLAMQVASDNAKDLIDELTLAYNKGRQQEITAEILDLVGGTMA
ncbi:MAG: ATP synthase F1 subunit gamma [Bacteroidales bacterium]|nr:ATP synthase F1 subunit gamma [Bacteroidales bacterium]